MRLQRHQTRRAGASKGAISTREADQALYEQENDQDRDEERPDARQGRHGRWLSGGEVLARSSLVVHGFSRLEAWKRWCSCERPLKGATCMKCRNEARWNRDTREDVVFSAGTREENARRRSGVVRSLGGGLS